MSQIDRDKNKQQEGYLAEGKFNTDPRRLWDFLEQIGVVTRPLTGNEEDKQAQT